MKRSGGSTHYSFRGLLFVLCACAVLLSVPVAAESPKEQYKRIQKELESHREKAEQAKRREYSVLEDLDSVSRRLAQIESELKKQRVRLKQTDSEIRAVEHEVTTTRKELDEQKKWLSRRLRAMQRYGQSNDMLFLLAATDDISALMRRWKYLEDITAYDRTVIGGYGKNLKKLDERERKLQLLNAALRKEEEKIKTTEETLSERRKSKEILLASVRKEKSTHEKMLKELQESSKRLLETIRKLEEKETFEAKGFPTSKGNLLWPVTGKVAIPYGSHKDPKFNTPVFRNGIYIKADEDSVRAVYSGKIVFSDWFKGYGNLIIINHGEGYHTLYGNLSETFLKVGDIIRAKEVIGKVGDSGIVNAPSLYFEVRYKGKPLDPMQWLKRR